MTISKHPYEHLYTLDEKRILAWPEQSIPSAIPQEVRAHAVQGAELHGFFEGKEVWFWTQDGVRAVLDFIEVHNSALTQFKKLWIIHYDVYFQHDGRHDFSQNLTHGFTAPGYWYGDQMRDDYLNRNDPAYETAVYWFWFEEEVGAWNPQPLSDERLQPKGCLGMILALLTSNR